MKTIPDNPKSTLSDYEKSINALIQAAAAQADRMIAAGRKTETRRGVNGEKFTWCFWSEFYHLAMNQMARDAGLRK